MNNTPVPFFDLGAYARLHQDEIRPAIERVFQSGWYILGSQLREFEKAIASSLAPKTKGFGIGVNSGTDALILSLISAGVKAGDEVISPSHTAIPGIVAILRTGGKPVFADIDSETWVLNLEDVKNCITPKTKAIIATHLYGICVDVLSLKALLSDLNREDILIIEDVAQAHGSTWSNRQAGTLGDFGAFSFYPSKNLGALGDAGLVYTQSLIKAEELRSLRNYGQTDRYHATHPSGLNSRLDEIQAAVLHSRLQHMDRANSYKITLVNRYREAFKKLPLQCQAIPSQCSPAWHLFVIALEDKHLRSALQKHLQSLQIGSLVHYPIPTHQQEAFDKFSNGPLPVTEQLCPRILSLPMNPTLSDSQQSKVIEAVISFFR